jgi:hypothetical protein
MEAMSLDDVISHERKSRRVIFIFVFLICFFFPVALSVTTEDGGEEEEDTIITMIVVQTGNVLVALSIMVNGIQNQIEIEMKLIPGENVRGLVLLKELKEEEVFHLKEE